MEIYVVRLLQLVAILSRLPTPASASVCPENEWRPAAAGASHLNDHKPDLAHALPAFATVRRCSEPGSCGGFLHFTHRLAVSGQAGEDKGMLEMPGSADLPAWRRERGEMPEL